MTNILKAFAVTLAFFAVSGAYAQTDEASGTFFTPDTDIIRSISVYPNPATERLLIEFTADKMDGEVLLRIRNNDNKVILKRNLFTLPGGNMVMLPVSALPTGAYLVQIDRGKKTLQAHWQKM